MTMFMTCTMTNGDADKLRINIALISNYFRKKRDNCTTILMANGVTYNVMETMEEIHNKLATRGIT